MTWLFNQSKKAEIKGRILSDLGRISALPGTNLTPLFFFKRTSGDARPRSVAYCKTSECFNGHNSLVRGFEMVPTLYLAC
jgi:hypothetical protein